ncbi:MAG: hypothetical protein PF495_06170 [Spirochaetales bacterium]|jgi:TATA-box binding protein (TBP) (component of TFIID and TFIIIB)|nr:hypothetical protein [Spirochaetales bacterium]
MVPKDTGHPKVKVTNIVAKSLLIPPFSLSPLSAAHPWTFNHGPIHIPISHARSKFSIFQTGTIISRGEHSIPDLEASFEWLRDYLQNSFNLKLISNFKILNIVAFATLPFHFNLFELASHIPSCSYDPTPLPSVRDGSFHSCFAIVYPLRTIKPRHTALIFSRGGVILTGFKSIPELELQASQLASLISQISMDHPEVIVR